MRFNPELHHRRSIRLQGYDHVCAGCYFVTICVHGRESLLGGIVEDKVALNDAGRMVAHWWHKIPEKFATAELDDYIIMPNHFHGSVILNRDMHAVGADPCVRPGSASSPKPPAIPRTHGAEPKAAHG